MKWTITAVLVWAQVTVAGPGLFLSREKAPPPSMNQMHPLLSRELLRQATLIAAHREMGLPVADEVLGEPAGAGQTTLIPDLVLPIKFTPATFALWQADASLPPVALDGHVWTERPQDAFVVAEALSRTTLPDLLKKAGLAGAANKSDPNGAADPAALAAIDRMELLSQLAGVRLIDQQIAKDGESPDRLVALARGYANAWQLSAYLWGGAPKNFAARALLYGQRAVIKFPDSVAALDGRGYAEAMVGLPKLALEDFDKTKSKRGSAAAPPWVELAVDLAHYDAGGLNDIAGKDKARAGAASFMAFLAVEHVPADAAPINFAMLAIKANPDCMRLLSAVTDRIGPGLGNWSSQAVGDAAVHELSTVDRLPGIPAAAAAKVAAFQKAPTDAAARKAVFAALHAAGSGDTAEPSWDAVARTLEDTTFISVVQPAAHLALRLGQDPAEAIDAARPLYAGHRYAPFLDALYECKRNPDAFRTKLGDVVIDDPTYAMSLVMTAWDGLKQAKIDVSRAVFEHLGDNTAGDQESLTQLFMQVPEAMQMMGGIIGHGMSEKLEKVAPNSPTVYAGKVYGDWAAAEPHVKEWLDETGDHPTLTLALANHYKQAGDAANAKAMFAKYLSVSPDPSVYGNLADMDLATGNDEKWLASVDESLKIPSPGLDNALLAWKTAVRLVDKNKAKEALKYARISAESGAEWGMRILIEVNERLRNFKEAEQVTIESARHYNKPLDHLAFCVRTGRGNRKVAEATAQQVAKALAGDKSPTAQGTFLEIDLLHNDLPSAQKRALAAVEEIKDPWTALIAWSIVAVKKDAKTSTHALELLDKAGAPMAMPDGSARPHLFQFIQELVQAVRIKDETFEPTIPDEVGPGSVDDDGANICYFTARYYEARGNMPTAIKYFQMSVNRHSSKLTRTLAAMRLRQLGHDPYAGKP